MHGRHRRGELHTILATFTSARSFSNTALRPLSLGDSHHFSDILKNCFTSKSIKKVHAQIITGGYARDQFVASKLVDKYRECSGSHSHLDDLRKVFDNLPERDLCVWNVVIKGYAGSGPPFVEDALGIYSEMRRKGVSPNGYTFTHVLKACGVANDGKRGQAIHGDVVKFGHEIDVFVGNALVAFYSKTLGFDKSRRLFDEIPCKDIVTWNSMISGCTANGRPDLALGLFHGLLEDDTVCAPDHATLVCILPACAQAAAIEEGMRIHSYIIKSGIEVDSHLGSGLISMYGNCGHLSKARVVFDQIRNKSITVWNAMIRCFGMHGQTDEALKLFSQLVDTGLCPDGILFVCLLSMCSHTGLVSKGRELFESMEGFGVEKGDLHYACMVDLLGRAGLIDEAVGFIKTMPVGAGKDVYGALLGACRMHGRLELAEEVAQELFVSDRDNAGRYITLARMYEDSQQWDNMARMRKALKEKRIRKPLGHSSIDVDGVVQTFGVDIDYHPFRDQIFDTVEWLNKEVELELRFNALAC